MKSLRVYLVGFLLIIVVVAACKNNSSNVHLIGTIKGAGNSMVYISKVGEFNMNTTVVDSMETVNGSFTHTLEISKSDSLFCLVCKGRAVYFLPDGDTIYFDGDTNNLMASKIKGSDSNALLSEYMESFYEVDDQAIALYSAYIEAQQKQNAAAVDSINRLMETIGSMILDLPNKYVIANKKNTGAAVILFLNLTSSRKDDVKLESWFTTLDKEVRNSPTGMKLERFISSLKACRIGKHFIDLELTNSQNQNVNISSVKGNYFLIEFWTTWCGPCRAELPNLKNAYNKYHNKGFDIFSISLDNSQEKWIKSIKQMDTPWPQSIIKNPDSYKSIFEPFESEVARVYAVLNVPSNYLVDPDGVIVAENLRGQTLIDELNRIYNQ